MTVKINFQSVFDGIGEAIFILNKKGEIVFINSYAAKITGCTIDDLYEKDFSDFIKIESFKHDQVVMDDLLRFPFARIHYHLNVNNTYKFPMAFSVSHNENLFGNEDGYVVVFRDETEQVEVENKLNESIVNLRKAIGGIVKAMESTIETRDPYTAGHQRRVADLSRRIGQAMSLSSNTVEGIRMAGILHDVGKISIPAEILSKPGNLSNEEFNLIKVHPLKGYEILKSIDFPWPLADIVYQHHERLDGSGYPRGLFSDDLLLESKIIGVADSVEAIASHRPYRPSLGVNSAIEELIQNKGILYDPDVVTACIQVLSDSAYVESFTDYTLYN